uniref:Acyl-coenzyme A thioesterase THEM4 n=1 Tax=Pycnococcus provasolii TaxID=41880 RepID=A0A7S2APK0_9CHLO|mmetsp:Transcript_13946/g.31955  ORF Transcript_13946/g.31955 Transcript_13946/m.31955 type:complete len:261 (+) Transcript_13946:42-824(+)
MLARSGLARRTWRSARVMSARVCGSFTGGVRVPRDGKQLHSSSFHAKVHSRTARTLSPSSTKRAQVGVHESRTDAYLALLVNNSSSDNNISTSSRTVREVSYQDWGRSANFTRAQGAERLDYRLFVSDDETEHPTAHIVAQIGTDGTEGVPGFVHGGLTSTLADTAMGNLAWYAGYKAFTANLNVDFRAPLSPPACVVVDAKIEKTEGRKVYLSADVFEVQEMQDGTLARSNDVVAEATSLFIVMDKAKATAVTTPDSLV